MITPFSMKAIIYCRVSSDRQAKEGHGIDGQERSCRTYAEQKDYEVIQVFKDEGVSGSLIDREGMQNLLDSLDANTQKDEYVVLIDDLKRLARDLIGHFTLRKAITSRKATLESPTHRFGENPEDKFVESILAATAELERNQNKRQVRKRMQARLENGYWTFYPPPGYRMEKVAGHGKLLVPKEPEASIIKEALEGFASSRFQTQVDVQQYLQSKDFRHWGYGKMTYLEQVKRLLTREVYAGYISYPKWNVRCRKGHHKALISGEIFERIQERLRERKRAPHRQNLHDDFPLRGFLLCSHCKRPYTSSWSKGRKQHFPYYRCTTQGCDFRNKSVRADTVHSDFEIMLKQLNPRRGVMKVVKEEMLHQWNEKMQDIDGIRQERQTKLDEIQKEITSYLDAIDKCSSPIVLKRIEEKIEDLEARKLRLGEKVVAPKRAYDFETALNNFFEFIEKPYMVWNTGDLKEKQLVLKMVFEEPLVYDREKGFGIAKFTLPVSLSCINELDKMELVDMPRIELTYPFLLTLNSKSE